MPSWLQITFTTHAEIAETLSDHLFAAGALSVTLQDGGEQPLYEPPLNTTPIWQQTQVVGLFEEETDIQQLQTILSEMLAPSPLPPFCYSQLANQEWERVWMTDFHPLCFGERLWICPSWHSPPDSQAINVLLDPGLAFGTGTHPTTALCLEWLAQSQELLGATLIDYGCGSGILAISAAKLGARQVWAVDHDPQALLATQENASKNQVTSQVEICLPENLPPLQVTGLLANILAKPLIELAVPFANYLQLNGFLVLSGILKEQISAVMDAYQPWFTIEEIVTQDEWVRVIARKKL